MSDAPTAEAGETRIDTGTDELLCVIRDRVAIITLNRPEVKNALSDHLTPALRTMIRTFGENVQRFVGDDRGDLENRIAIGVQTGHFQVDPDQVLRVLHIRAPRQCCAV